MINLPWKHLSEWLIRHPCASSVLLPSKVEGLNNKSQPGFISFLHPPKHLHCVVSVRCLGFLNLFVFNLCVFLSCIVLTSQGHSGFSSFQTKLSKVSADRSYYVGGHVCLLLSLLSTCEDRQDGYLCDGHLLSLCLFSLILLKSRRKTRRAEHWSIPDAPECFILWYFFSDTLYSLSEWNCNYQGEEIEVLLRDDFELNVSYS